MKDKMPTYVTVVIPADSKILELPWALWNLEPGAQSVPVHVRVFVSNSTDGTQEWLLADATREAYLGKFRDFETIVMPDKTEHAKELRKHKSLEHTYKKAFTEAETEFVLTLDADVMLPPGGLRHLVEHLWAHKGLAGYGFRYDFKVDHLQMGCTLWRTSALKELNWSRDKRCICHWLNDTLTAQGWTLAHAEYTSARHLKLEKGR